MATSIISTGTFLLGLSWLSRVLLVITLTGLVVLSVALVIQLIFFRPDLAGVAAAVWLVLTYAVPASLLLARSHDSVLGSVNGTWLLCRAVEHRAGAVHPARLADLGCTG